MAGGKETPRQKMIGLMYLVLMALLAMNVSKEIINAFITLDNKLIEGNEAFVSKGNSAFGRIALANQVTNNDVTNFWHAKAERVRGIAKRMDTYIFDLKAIMLAESATGPGSDINDWVNTAEDGTRSIKDLLEVDAEFPKKDDYDTPTRMYGGEAGLPGYEKGAEIRTKIHLLRDSLIYEVATHKFGGDFTFNIENGIADTTALQEGLKGVNEKDVAVIKQLYFSLTQPETMKNHGEDQAWQVVMFDHAPVVAAAAMFSSIQNDVRNAEATTLDHLLTKVEVPPVKFNRVEAKPIGAAYVNQGDSLNLKVIIAAWDDSEFVESEYSFDEGATQNAIKEKGYASISAPSTSVGPHTLKGNVMVEVDGKKVAQPWTFDYVVGAPNATASPADLNVLYRQWDNKIEVSAGGYPPESIKVSCSGCSISKKGEFYIAKVSGTGKKATISISADVDGRTVPIAKKEMRIFPLPDPRPYFAGQTFDRTALKVGKAKQGVKLVAKLGDSPLNVPYEVTSFEMYVPGKGGKVEVLKSKSSRLSSQMRGAISKMRPGASISFSKIEAKVVGKGKPKPIPPLTFKLI